MNTAAAERGRSGDEDQRARRRTPGGRPTTVTRPRGRHRALPPEPARPLQRFRTAGHGGDRSAAGSADCRSADLRAPVRLRTAEAENFHVNLPLRGRAASRSGTGEPVTTRPGEGLVFSPGAPAEMSWSADCEQLCLMVPRARLEAELEQLLGRPLRGRLVFDFAADLRARWVGAGGRCWTCSWTSSTTRRT